MSNLIRNSQLVDDPFSVVEAPPAGAAEVTPEAAPPLPDGALLVPLAVWRSRRAELLGRAAPVGVWLDPAEDPADLRADLALLPLIAINFPKFTDGRGYSLARLLRERHGYAGEIRAIGDVLHDQLFLMARCGFDAFALKDGKNAELALRAFETFREPYQAAVDRAEPLFRRHRRAA